MARTTIVTVTTHVEIDLDAYNLNYGEDGYEGAARGYAVDLAQESIALRLDAVGGWAKVVTPERAADQETHHCMWVDGEAKGSEKHCTVACVPVG